MKSTKGDGELGAGTPRRLPQGRKHIVTWQKPERDGKPRVDLGLRQGTGERRQYTGAYVKKICRKFEVEQGKFGFLEL